MIERLDLTNKQTWMTTPPEELARYFGYEPDDNFNNALNSFMRVVKKARITLFLSSLAMNFFRNYQPPLQRLEEK